MELRLDVKRARISSDGGWFVDGKGFGCACCVVLCLCVFDALREQKLLTLCNPQNQTKTKTKKEFHACERGGGRVTDASKLHALRHMLDIDDAGSSSDDQGAAGDGADAGAACG